MPRRSSTGIRGLHRECVVDEATGKETFVYSISLRFRDPVTGKSDRYHERMNGMSAAAAKVRAQKVVNGLLGGTFDPRKEKKQRDQPQALGEALDAVVKWAETNRPASLQYRRTQTKALKEIMGAGTRLDALSAWSVERFKSARYKALRKAAGVDVDDEEDRTGAASVNRGLSCLKHAATLWKEWGWISAATAAAIHGVGLLKEPPGRVRHMQPEEEARLMPKLSARVKVIAAASALSGLRRSEIVRIKKTEVDLHARELTVTKSKANKTRQVPINDALAALLEAAMAQSPSEYVFTNRRGLPYHPDSLTHAFVRACKRAKVTDLRWHDLRHHFATTLRRTGAGLDEIMQLLGHAHISMTQRYAHVGREQLHQAVARIGSPPAIATPLPPAPADGDEKPAPVRLVSS